MQATAGLLRLTEWFGGCPDHVVERCAALCEVRRLDRDGVVYTAGKDADAFFVLLDGRVGAWRDAEVETESMLYFVADQPQTTLCLENVVADIPYFATMRSLDRGTQVLVVPAAALDLALEVDPGLGVEIARHIARRLQAFTETLTDLGTLNVARRVAKYLVTHADASGMVVLPTSQGDLASRLGASRQSVSTALSTFIQRGFIAPAGRGAYHVVGVEPLRSLARNPQPRPVERLS